MYNFLFPFQINTPTVKTGSGVSSELVIQVEPSDNGMMYKCEANNSATKLPLVAFIKLLVHCKEDL